MERDLSHAATHDALTDLHNRSAFQKILESTWAEAQSSGRRHAIRRAHYLLPERPGYSIEIRRQSLEEYSFPDGSMWLERG